MCLDMGVEPVKFVERGGRMLIPIGREVKKAPARRCDEGKAVDPLRESRKGHSTEGRM